MNLPDLPIKDRILFLGVGGGYDILGAIPIYETLNETLNQTHVVFATASEVTEMGPRYLPFYQWRSEGVVPLTAALKDVIQKHKINTIIAVDGGVDSLMHGNEDEPGTVLQDFITLAALDNVSDGMNIILACSGLGCEAEEHMNFYAVMENISTLIRSGGFYGSCSLLPDTEKFRFYKEAVNSTVRKSHIQTRVMAAAEGQFGEIELGTDPNLINLDDPDVPCIVYKPTISAFMSMYWFFDLDEVVLHNRTLQALKNSQTMTDALRAYRKVGSRVRPYRPFTI